MKQLLYLTALLFLITSCREEKKEPNPSNESLDETVVEVDFSRFPDNYKQVLQAHGGLENWRKMRSMTYTMPGDNGDEIQTVDLATRNTLVETASYKMGNDGKELWLAQDSTYFNPERVEFYHNLMFYFYAMPFVLADDGITYAQAPALELDDKRYPGIKVSYGDNIGASPEDEYILYMDPDSKTMAWLAYTVTYGQNSKSDRFSFIKYDKWQEVNGLQLPEELTWYTVENGKPTKPAGPPRRFTKVDVDAAPMSEKTYQKPEGAMIIEPRKS